VDLSKLDGGCSVCEGGIKRAIIESLNATGLVRVWNSPAGRVRARGAWVHLAPEGCPDVVGFALWDGRFVGLEIKDPKGTTDKARAEKQRKYQQIIAAHGGISGQVTSVVEAIDLVRAALTACSGKAGKK